MGLLPSQHKEPDFGQGYGFIDFEDAFNSIDHENPPVGKTFKISGDIYRLTEDLDFEELVDG